MIRNPVERFVSHFNYKRNGDTKSEGHKTSNYTIDERNRDDHYSNKILVRNQSDFYLIMWNIYSTTKGQAASNFRCKQRTSLNNRLPDSNHCWWSVLSFAISKFWPNNHQTSILFHFSLIFSLSEHSRLNCESTTIFLSRIFRERSSFNFLFFY